MKRCIEPFGSQQLLLRLSEAKDLGKTLSWRNHVDSRVWFKTSTPLTLEQHLKWFNQYLDRDNDFLFIIENEGIPAGQASVYGIDWQAGTAEVGRFLVAPESRGRGIMSEACRLLLQFCSQKLSLNYLFLEVIENNLRAIKLYEKNGFKEEQRHGNLIRMGRSIA